MRYPIRNALRTRREFIKATGGGIGLIALGAMAPAFLANSVRAGTPTSETDRSILVLIQLGGGNDGLNTLIPYQDDLYYHLRPTIGIKKNELLKLDDTTGLHSKCSELEALFKDGNLAIVQNVGYPNPNRSHFRSAEIWETASKSTDYLSTGWLGRYFDNCCAGTPHEDPHAVNIGDELPDTFLSQSNINVYSHAGRKRSSSKERQATMEALQKTHFEKDSNASFLQHVSMNAMLSEKQITSRISKYKSSIDYPQNNLAQDLKQVAAMIASGQKTRVYFVSHTGFDTHANQLQRHAQLLSQLSSAMSAFQRDLKKQGLDEQVLTMTFSEFGRRPNENKSGGTDHGTAAPLFVMGSKLKGGLHGDAPNLKVEKNKDLKFSTDFRSVYSTVVDRWLEGDAEAALGGKFQQVPFI